MNVLDLFSGIGGFSLGLERAGMRAVAFCEIEPYPQAVLRKHWPGIPIYDDIRTLTAERLRTDGIPGIDVICGGFPCQDISRIGKKAGISGSRSGLWIEFARLIGELRPRYVLVENVPDLLIRGMQRVLGDLAALRYDAEWEVLTAAAFGAIHIRERVFLLGMNTDIARNRCGPFGTIRPQRSYGQNALYSRISKTGFWETEPGVVRVANGVPSRVDRIRGLGNAVVPQIPEIIGRAIIQAEAQIVICA